PLPGTCLFRGSADSRGLRCFPTRRSSDLVHALRRVEGDPDVDAMPAAGCEGEIGHVVLIEDSGDVGGAGDDLVQWHRLFMVIEVDRKSTRLNSSHVKSSYAVVCLKINTPP